MEETYALEEGKQVAAFLDIIDTMTKPYAISLEYKKVQRKRDSKKINLRKGSNPIDYPWMRRTVTYRDAGPDGKNAFNAMRNLLRKNQTIVRELCITTCGQVFRVNPDSNKATTLFGVPMVLNFHNTKAYAREADTMMKLTPGHMATYSVRTVPVFDGKGKPSEKDQKVIQRVKNIFDAVSLPF